MLNSSLFLVNENFAMNPTNIALSATVNTSTIIVNVFILFWVKVAIIFWQLRRAILSLVNIKMQCVHSEKVKESISIFLDVPWCPLGNSIVWNTKELLFPDAFSIAWNKIFKYHPKPPPYIYTLAKISNLMILQMMNTFV